MLVKSGQLSSSTLKLDYLAKDCLCDFFGTEKLNSEISCGDAEDFRIWLLTSGGRPAKRCGTEIIIRERKPLNEATTRKRCSIASKFFRDAMKRGLINQNPIEGVSKSNMATNNHAFISTEDAEKVLAELPDLQWKLLFAFPRWGGLRVGSEVRRLKWSDIDWENQQILVHSKNTAHIDGCGTRYVPMFPELTKLLQDLFKGNPENDSLVLPMLSGRTDASLRAPLIRAIKKAGIKVWPRLWHNLRSTRQTELLDVWRQKLVCAWLGNR